MKVFVVPRIIANIIQLILSIILVVLALHLIHLALGYILNSFRVEDAVDEIFSAIWLITVALAVFDLAGIIFDEITWSGSKKELKEFKWQFTKFLIVIITALSIETLVVFFRVAKKDVTLLLYPALSIAAVCFLIISLGYYVRQNNISEAVGGEDSLHILKMRLARGEIDKEEFREKAKLLTG